MLYTERRELKRRARQRSLAVELVKRTEVILMLAAGHSYREVRQQLDCSDEYIREWKRRFQEERGVMDPYGWMGLEELENILGFMCAQVVGHDINLSTLSLAGDHLAQKLDKLGAGMASGGLSHDVAGASIERCIQ